MITIAEFEAMVVDPAPELCRKITTEIAYETSFVGSFVDYDAITGDGLVHIQLLDTGDGISLGEKIRANYQDYINKISITHVKMDEIKEPFLEQ